MYLAIARTNCTGYTRDMNSLKEIRWKQRFTNLKRAFTLLWEAAEKQQKNRLEQEGMVQRFEYTFELCWKTLKDYLESQGVLCSFPRDVIKEAVQTNMLDHGELWLEMLDGRNFLSHTYDESHFNMVIEKIQEAYVPEIKKLVAILQEKLE